MKIKVNCSLIRMHKQCEWHDEEMNENKNKKKKYKNVESPYPFKFSQQQHVEHVQNLN